MKKISVIISLLVCFCFNTANADILKTLFNFDNNNNIKDDCKVINGSQICHLYLIGEVESAESYKKEYKLFYELKKDDVIYLHLEGPGGQGNGLVYLLNAIKNSKAKVIPVVDGSVASCDAVLAVSTKEIILSGDAYIYFHNISTSNMTDEICREQSGTDRGLALYQKCMEDMPKITKFYNNVIMKYVKPVLTPEEYKLYEEGHDIIITSDELKPRLQALGVIVH